MDPMMAPNSDIDAQGNRARGWILLVLGPLLSAGMAALSLWLWRVIHAQSLPGATAHWSGSHEMTVNAFSLFATIFVFGLVCTGAGLFQVRTGRRHWAFIVALLLLVAAMIYFGYGIMQRGR